LNGKQEKGKGGKGRTTGGTEKEEVREGGMVARKTRAMKKKGSGETGGKVRAGKCTVACRERDAGSG